jgi:hypothetical protein
MSENSFWTDRKCELENINLSDFKTNSFVHSIPIYSYAQYEDQYGENIKEMLSMMSLDDRQNWLHVLPEPKLGHTTESYSRIQKNIQIDGIDYITSPWSLKSNHHALSYVHHTGKKFSDYDQIVEFGPGIGDTCRVINELGFKGNYYLYDLPEVYRISSFYNSRFKNVKTINHYSEVSNEPKTLFIGTWSTSEIPHDYRTEIFTHFKNANYLLIYQNHIFEYSNEAFFTKEFPEIINQEIKSVYISWLGGMAGGNYYLFTT